MNKVPPWLYVTRSGSLRLDLREYLKTDQARRQIADMQALERMRRRRIDMGLSTILCEHTPRRLTHAFTGPSRERRLVPSGRRSTTGSLGGQMPR